MLDDRNDTTSARQIDGRGVWDRSANAYASASWAPGGAAELHVWAGGFHGYDGIAPQAAVSVATRDARARFLSRVLDLPGPGARVLREEWY
jgi:hypothetical protein